MKIHKKRLLLPLVVFLSTISASAIDQPERWLKDSLPSQWEYVSTYTQKLPADDDWWKTFGDSTLDSLIEIASKENYNVAAAVSRIDMAKKTLDAAKAAYFPSVNLAAGWSKGQSSGASGASVVKSAPTIFFV